MAGTDPRTPRTQSQVATTSHLRGTWLTAPACAEDSALGRTPTWPDTFITRVEAVALLQTLNANLLSHDSATSTLERWCDVHRLASPARIVAVRIPDGEKNKVLDSSDVPFGRVVQALHFRRHTLSSTQLWFPLPEGWEMNAIPPSDPSSFLTIPPELLQHRALLTLPDGTPISEVVETYTAGILAFHGSIAGR
jgi:hypothetical protein